MPRKYDDDEDDRFEDDEDYEEEEDERDEPPPLKAGQLRRAKARVQGPAILLIVYAGLGLLVFGYNVITGLRDPLAAFKKQRVQTENDPKLAPEDRRALKGINDDIENAVKPFVPLFQLAIVLSGVFPLVVIAGAVSMLRFFSKGLASAGAVAAFLPCTGCCCLLGLGGGIWSFSAMADRDVKAAFAAGGRLSSSRRRDDD